MRTRFIQEVLDIERTFTRWFEECFRSRQVVEDKEDCFLAKESKAYGSTAFNLFRHVLYLRHHSKLATDPIVSLVVKRIHLFLDFWRSILNLFEECSLARPFCTGNNRLEHIIVIVCPSLLLLYHFIIIFIC